MRRRTEIQNQETNLPTRYFALFRASANEPDLNSQKLEVCAYCEKHGIVEFSGCVEETLDDQKSPERKANILLRAMRRGDVLLLTEISRLGKTMDKALILLMDLVRKIGATVIAVRGGKYGSDGVDIIVASVKLMEAEQEGRL